MSSYEGCSLYLLKCIDFTTKLMCVFTIHHLGLKAPAVYLLEHLQSGFSDNPQKKQEREASFAQKKAERATVRSHFREKYRLPKNETDETQIQQAGEDVVLPTELAKMIAEDNQEEAHKQSVLGQLSNIQNVDIDQLKDKAQATLEDLKKQTENCSLM
ncbi:complexin-3b isoform X1 [Thunnus maccoyii]|uniref:complexin-3b isoform X1 n=1 Tax=Thunnus maccoyii TaxID=8240 RepID=UPI001C4A82E5|nr:complexin-3b isoform X1 [Thunnus maccoyii]